MSQIVCATLRFQSNNLKVFHNQPEFLLWHLTLRPKKIQRLKIDEKERSVYRLGRLGQGLGQVEKKN